MNTPDVSLAELLQILSTLASGGGFGALAWYLLVKHIPKQMAEEREERRKMSEDYKRALDAQNEHCIAEMASTRQEHREREKMLEMRSAALLDRIASHFFVAVKEVKEGGLSDKGPPS